MKRTATITQTTHRTEKRVVRSAHKRNGRKKEPQLFHAMPPKPEPNMEDTEKKRRLVEKWSEDAIRKTVAKLRSRPGIDDEE